MKRSAFIILLKFVLSCLVWIDEANGYLLASPPEFTIDGQDNGVLLSTGYHSKSCRLIFLLQPWVLLDFDLLGHPLHNLEVLEAQLAMVASAPAIQLMVDVNGPDIVPLFF